MVADASDNFHVVKKKLRTIFMGVEPFNELLFAAGELHQSVQKTTDGLFYRLQIIACPLFQNGSRHAPAAGITLRVRRGVWMRCGGMWSGKNTTRSERRRRRAGVRMPESGVRIGVARQAGAAPAPA